mgnify:CR=1 FL=1
MVVSKTPSINRFLTVNANQITHMSSVDRQIMANAIEKIYNERMTSSEGEVQDENVARTWPPMNEADFQIMLKKLVKNH